ncbi:MAG: phosphotransferase family protein [Polyangiales bacterium]
MTDPHTATNNGIDSNLDAARAVRAGEELDLGKLATWLSTHAPSLRGPYSLQQFPSGHSNLTYLLSGFDEAAAAREWVLRRPPFGSKVKTAHDMGREHRILCRLHAVYPRAPEPVVHCDDVEVIGAPFYLMKRIEGVILRKSVPASLGFDEARTRLLHERFVDALVELHALDFQAAGLGDLGKPTGYVERQVKGWTERYRGSQTDDIADVEALTKWVGERIPKESGAALIHNDYKLDNLVLEPRDPTRIVGLLDWEMSTLGDPLMDLGSALGYWVEARDADDMKSFAFGPTHVPGSLTRRQLVERYGERSGRDVTNMLFYYCFALLKNVVIAQQIYYRYQQGLTRDERFGAFIHGVRIVARTAVEAIGAGSFGA